MKESPLPQAIFRPEAPSLVVDSTDNPLEAVCLHMVYYCSKLVTYRRLPHSRNVNSICHLPDENWDKTLVARRRTLTDAAHITETPDVQNAIVPCKTCAHDGTECFVYTADASEKSIRSDPSNHWYKEGAIWFRKATVNRCAACFIGDGKSAYTTCNAKLEAEPVNENVD
jgi:hypothetical protein